MILLSILYGLNHNFLTSVGSTESVPLMENYSLIESDLSTC